MGGLFGGGRGGIAAHGAAVEEHSFFAGETARRAADGGKEASAIWAGFYLMTNLLTAIITKKTWFFLHYADFDSLDLSTELLEDSELAGHFAASLQPAQVFPPETGASFPVESGLSVFDLVFAVLLLSVT
ncbi:MAG: hypothetical protein LBU66_03955 [Treponema sp.]|nr:hypothetical protein [Treponema sp.]